MNMEDYNKYSIGIIEQDVICDNPSLRRLRQENGKFETNLSYTMTL